MIRHKFHIFPRFRPVSESMPQVNTFEFHDESIAEDVYPFLDPSPSGTDTLVPDFIPTEFPEVFADEGTCVLPPHRPHDSVICLTADAKPYYGKPYNLTLDEKLAMKSWIDENLSKSPLLLLVPRVCL
jgi:hypothetical protein